MSIEQPDCKTKSCFYTTFAQPFQPMKPRVILDDRKFKLTLQRLCHQLVENHKDFANTVLIGVQPRGPFLSNRLRAYLQEIVPGLVLPHGNLDITFYRDDFRSGKGHLSPNNTSIEFSVEHKRVILVDDVLYTGRTIRAAMDALLDFGRPETVELVVLIDRRFSRELPIHPDYVGKTIDSIESERIRVEWKDIDGQDKVWLEEHRTD